MVKRKKNKEERKERKERRDKEGRERLKEKTRVKKRKGKNNYRRKW